MLSAANLFSGVNIFFAFIGVAGVVTTAVVVVFGARNRAVTSIQSASIEALEGTVTALQADSQRQVAETAHLRYLLEEKQRQIDVQAGSIKTLERVVTSRDIIFNGFRHLGVPPEVLAAGETR